MKRFQYYTAENFRKDFRTIVVIFITLLFIIQIRIKRLKVKALINLDAIGNFINKEFTRKNNYKKKALKELYNLLMFNETSLIYNNNKIIYHSGKVRLQMDGLKKNEDRSI